MRAYLAGPMHGLPEWNYPAFFAAAEQWRRAGHTVVNPAENHGGRTDLSLADYMRIDLPQICDCDALVVLPGWRFSGGAGVEVTLARYLGLPILDADTMLPVHETVLQEAQRLVHGDRGNDYGHPADDLGRTAAIWSGIFGMTFTAEMVALAMIGVKTSRLMNSLSRGQRPHHDSVVDIAGYAEVINMIDERRADR